MAPSEYYQHIFEVVSQIPTGKVATYGQVARLAGYPGHARQVGYALFRLADPASTVPWQRVVNAKGQISYSPRRYGSDELQRVLLEAEGVIFDTQGAIDLQRFGWQPDKIS
ncbi:MAG: methyltransferase [Synechococcaceae cyanobacterium SM2_3_1]|nr:methyltransferase [Synechococcaceae cyanobacterium SM2_3_1]